MPSQTNLSRPHAFAATVSAASRARGIAFLVLTGSALTYIASRDVTNANPYFHPHGYCYLWEPALVWTHAGADVLIGTAYMTIPIALLAIMRRAQDRLPFSGLLVVFGTFIIACGFTHFAEVLTLWHPLFWTAASVKVVTAIASVATAVAVPPLVPKVLAMIDAASLADERQVQLQRAHAELEHRVETRTRELTTTVAQLREEVAARRRAEERLVLRESQLQGILDHSPSYIYLKDAGRRFTLVNRQLADAYGGADKLLGLSNAELFEPDAAAEYDRNDLAALAGETVHAIEHELLSDGVHTFLSEKFPVRDSSGAVVALGGISTDVTDRERLRQDREAILQRERELRQQAEESVREKDRFLAVLSHELRTPLNAVLGYMHMLRNGTIPPDKVSAAVTTVQRNAKVLGRLVEDLLTVSTLVTGRLTLQRRPLDVAHVVQAAIAAVQPDALAREVVLEAALGRVSLPAVGDDVRLQQVFTNLLANAIKFSAPGGRVRVEGGVDNGRIRVAVADDGAGIPAEVLPYVFDMFRQGDSAPAGEAGGMGLGLTIVQRLVDAHGGEVRAESGGGGQGAVFTVWLPLLEAGGPGRA